MDKNCLDEIVDKLMEETCLSRVQVLYLLDGLFHGASTLHKYDKHGGIL